MNAPTAFAMDTPLRLVARSAAPGVDQEVTTGALYRSDRPAQVTAIPTPSASIHEETSRASAPAARAAVNTRAAALVTPTVTAMSPAATAEGGAAARMRASGDMRASLPEGAGERRALPGLYG